LYGKTPSTVRNNLTERGSAYRALRTRLTGVGAQALIRIEESLFIAPWLETSTNGDEVTTPRLRSRLDLQFRRATRQRGAKPRAHAAPCFEAGPEKKESRPDNFHHDDTELPMAEGPNASLASSAPAPSAGMPSCGSGDDLPRSIRRRRGTTPTEPLGGDGQLVRRLGAQGS